MYREKGIVVQMSSALHHLFATLLAFSELMNAEELRSKYYENLLENFHNDTDSKNKAWILCQTVTIVQNA